MRALVIKTIYAYAIQKKGPSHDNNVQLIYNCSGKIQKYIIEIQIHKNRDTDFYIYILDTFAAR